jgi:hypothetical protein
MSVQTQEVRIILIIEAIQTSKKLSYRKATKTYNVPESILRDKIAGRTPRNKTLANSLNLTELEE